MKIQVLHRSPLIACTFCFLITYHGMFLWRLVPLKFQASASADGRINDEKAKGKFSRERRGLYIHTVW